MRAKRRIYLPVVLSLQEAQRLLSHMHGTNRLMTQLPYGTGMRLHECFTLRVKDIDFGNRKIYARRGKGTKDQIRIPESW